MANIDKLIYEREQARRNKNWQLSDEIRDYLESQLVFVFDTKEGQEVYHLNEKYFTKKPKEMSHRKYLEEKIKEDIRAEKNFEAWLFSMNNKLKTK
jgi:hypothetical protein